MKKEHLVHGRRYAAVLTQVHLLPAQQAVIIIQNPENRIALNVQQHSLIQMGRAKLSHQLPAIK